MSQDDTGGFSLTNPADSASSGEAGAGGGIGADSRTMTGSDLGGRSRVQARVQAGVQDVAGVRTPIGSAMVGSVARGSDGLRGVGTSFRLARHRFDWRVQEAGIQPCG
jgi:hypothetical protein